MTAVIQRVRSASVRVDGNTVGSCAKGLCILLGVAEGDTREHAQALAKKIINLRIFEDGEGKMNLSLADVGGELLVISNFTLLASYKKGNRPDYMRAAKPDTAKELYEYFAGLLSESAKTERGIFGADMQIEIGADGPVTIVMESDVLLGKANH